MRETAFLFPNREYSLFGILHEPAGDTAKSAFVFCHPFGEEKLWTHRVFVAFARQLAAAGHPVLRFDYMGNGDSEGDFSASSLATVKSDVHCAIARVRGMTGARRVSLLGLRFGASVASLVAEEAAEIDRLILWAPIIDGERYMQEMLRINLTTQMALYKEVRHDREALVDVMRRGGTVNVDGYEVGFPLYSQISAVKLAGGRKLHEGACLIAGVDRRPRPVPELQQLSAAYADATITFAEEEPFWKEIARSYQRPAANLFNVTLEWLSRQ